MMMPTGAGPRFDPQDIATAFMRLADLTDSERDRFRQSAFDAAKARFDRAQLGARLAGHLDSLLSRPKARHNLVS
jgi:hypothetical protein